MGNLELESWKDAIALLDNGLRHILGDLETIANNRERLPMSFPQILLVFSGIEFLGSILYGLKGSKTSRVSKYVSDWMPENYNRKIGNKTLGAFLYDSLRSGLVHYGTVKGDIVVDHDIAALSWHLQWVDHHGGRRLFIHGYQFASDFVGSVKRVKEGISSGIISLDAIKENSTTLNSILERSTRREPLKTQKSNQAILDWQNGDDLPNLPDSTTGTSYSGGF